MELRGFCYTSENAAWQPRGYIPLALGEKGISDIIGRSPEGVFTANRGKEPWAGNPRPTTGAAKSADEFKRASELPECRGVPGSWEKPAKSLEAPSAIAPSMLIYWAVIFFFAFALLLFGHSYLAGALLVRRAPRSCCHLYLDPNCLEESCRVQVADKTQFALVRERYQIATSRARPLYLTARFCISN